MKLTAFLNIVLINVCTNTQMKANNYTKIVK